MDLLVPAGHPRKDPLSKRLRGCKCLLISRIGKDIGQSRQHLVQRIPGHPGLPLSLPLLDVKLDLRVRRARRRGRRQESASDRRLALPKLPHNILKLFPKLLIPEGPDSHGRRGEPVPQGMAADQGIFPAAVGGGAPVGQARIPAEGSEHAPGVHFPDKRKYSLLTRQKKRITKLYRREIKAFDLTVFHFHHSDPDREGRRHLKNPP